MSDTNTTVATEIAFPSLKPPPVKVNRLLNVVPADLLNLINEIENEQSLSQEPRK